MTAARNPTARSERGFIVVAVLWILAALAALVLVYLTYVTNTAIVVAGSTERIQTEALVSAGLELTALKLSSTDAAVRPTSGTFSARVGAGRLFVTFRSEAARIDLNAAPKGLLSGLMVGLGVKAPDADVYADRIVAWRSSTEQGAVDPETVFYQNSGVAYAPRHAPFPSADELWLVYGIPPVVVERMLPYVTVFSNSAQVNVADAAPQVLAALPNMTPEALQAVLAQRADPSSGPPVLPGGEGTSQASSKAYRVNVDAELPDGQRRGSEVVILLLESGDEPYRVLSWRNNSDGSTAPQRISSR